ncbi:MAG: ABC transporter ATP-binding protein [Actinomycetota bacterium]
MSSPLLSVEDLRVHFPTDDGLVKAVDGVSFSLERGETLAIVGESGSGKSVSSLTIMGLVRKPVAQITGRVEFDGSNLLELSHDQMRGIRGKRIAMIFQDPLSSLHPFFRVGPQIEEAILEHTDIGQEEAHARAIEMLRLVGIPTPDVRARSYPHEFSGGMRQRAMIAMALSCNPDILIADEPTTALDVTVQAQILELIRQLQKDFNSAVIIVTHDLGVVAGMVDKIMVMYAGRCVEFGDRDTIFKRPQHPYTWGLLNSVPRLDVVSHERLQPIQGLPPSLINVPPGCPFHPRCPYRFEPCDKDRPELLEAEYAHGVACHLAPVDRETIWARDLVRR